MRLLCAGPWPGCSMVLSGSLTRLPGKVQTQPDGGEGWPKARVLQQCAPEGSRRQKRGSTYRYAPHPEGGGQADLRRGKAGTSPQHRTKSYIRHMDEPRISDDRALKVAAAHPGRSHASRIAGCSKLPVSGETGHPNPWRHLDFRASTSGAPNPGKGRKTRNRKREGNQPNRVSEPQGEPITYGESAEGILSRWKRAGPPKSGEVYPEASLR
jgi:hypothetical protein